MAVNALLVPLDLRTEIQIVGVLVFVSLVVLYSLPFLSFLISLALGNALKQLLVFDCHALFCQFFQFQLLQLVLQSYKLLF